MPSRQAQPVQPSTAEQEATVEEAEALQGQVDAATQRAIDSRADNQPSTTKKAYSRPQAMWTVSPFSPLNPSVDPDHRFFPSLILP